jgi:hypothetical protein
MDLFHQIPTPTIAQRESPFSGYPYYDYCLTLKGVLSMTFRLKTESSCQVCHDIILLGEQFAKCSRALANPIPISGFVNHQTFCYIKSLRYVAEQPEEWKLVIIGNSLIIKQFSIF